MKFRNRLLGLNHVVLSKRRVMNGIMSISRKFRNRILGFNHLAFSEKTEN